jgi:hypothetical protein
MRASGADAAGLLRCPVMTSRRSAISALRLGALALVAVGVVGFRQIEPADGVGPTEISSATQQVRTATASARVGEITESRPHANEKVRYDDASLRIVASYSVDASTLDRSATATHARLWQLVQEVWPAEYVAMVRQLNIITDGTGGTLGMVHRSGIDPSSWILSLDDAEPDDVLRPTLVHELAHVLTMVREDLSVISSSTTCDGRRIEIGCAHTGSPLAQWASLFWSDGRGAGIVEPTTDDRQRFVTSYAATSVHEDLAESFMAWVLGSAGNSRTLSAAKAAFFEQRPEFVTVRDEILERTKIDRAA